MIAARFTFFFSVVEKKPSPPSSKSESANCAQAAPSSSAPSDLCSNAIVLTEFVRGDRRNATGGKDPWNPILKKRTPLHLRPVGGNAPPLRGGRCSSAIMKKKSF